MSGLVVVLLLSAAMMTMVWIALGHRPTRHKAEPRIPGQLSAAERRRLYRRLGIDPAALARAQHSNVIWLNPQVIDRRRTDA